MDELNSSVAVLAICLDTQSLSYNARFSLQDTPGRELPRSLVERLTWRSDRSTGPSHFQSRNRFAKGVGNRQRLIAQPSFDIMEAGSAADALSLLRLLRFDLGLIGADTLGAAVPSLLKQIQVVSPGTRCVVVSSEIDQRREQSIREAGVLAILDAPLPLNQLREVVCQLVASR
jgi:hypothetical protein